MWNTHRIRASRNQICPSGRPVIMYNFPHLYHAESHVCKCVEMQIQLCMEECIPKGPYPCDKTVFDLCCLFMDEARMDQPSNPEEATVLYNYLRNIVTENT